MSSRGKGSDTTKDTDDGQKSNDDLMEVEEEPDKEDNKEKDATENDEEEEEGEEEEEDDYEFKWLDKGKRRHGRVEYDSVLLTLHETSFRVSKNDFVLLWGIHGDENQEEKESEGANQSIEEIWQSAGCAKVEAMWEEKPTNKNHVRNKAMFQARWFFQKNELERIIKKEGLTGPITMEALKKRMRPREVVGSMEVGTYVMNTIGGPARVFFRSCPEAEEKEGNKENKSSEEEQEEEPQLPKDAFMCRYSLKKVEKGDDDEDGSADSSKVLMEVVPYAPDESTDEDDDDDKSSRKRRRGSDKENDTVDEDGSSAESSSDEESRLPEGEGSITNQGKIRVGPQHQVPVPEYDPSTKIVSRNPTLVWSPKKTPTQEQLDEYFQRAAAILTPFAEQQLLVMGTEPFTSIPSDQMEELMREREANAPLTVSSISTSASLAAKAAKSTLLRECDADALLKNLHDQNYSVEAAVAMISASPRDFLTKWTLQEREGFDDAFRQHGGSLRMVAKSMTSLSSTKTHCQVVDYHYRFKIPDQFRRYQDKKREQAVRMMECIEARRHQDSSEVHIVPQCSKLSGDVSGEEASNKKQKIENWSEMGTGDVTKAVEERRSAAKQLLLDIQRDMGKDKMAEVAGAIISLNQGSERESKEALLRILKNQPQLHQRLVEFLPRRFWK